MASVLRFHQLVAKNAKVFKAAWRHAAKLVQNQLPPSIRPTQAQLQPILARNAPRHPIHRVAFLKQSKGRWYSTHSAITSTVRRFTSAATRSSGVKYDRSSFPKSRTGFAVNSQSGRAPFASTLRPNLTGGTLGRTAGGYAWGSGRAGGARYFSHGPAAPAQVINNVSQAVRAFMISGSKAQFDGIDPRTGEKRFKSVSALQDKVNRTLNRSPRATPGTTVSFNINPTVTALSPLKAVKGFPSFAQEKETLNQDGLMDVLSVDFSRAVKELAAVLRDLQRLSSLGDLPITYESSKLRVHFPGCNFEIVETICDELGVQRGVIQQDEDFDSYVGTDIALLFPFAPSRTPSECSFYEKSVTGRQQPIDWRNMMTPSELSDNYSTHSEYELDFENVTENPYWASSPSGYESLHESELEDSIDLTTPLEYQGIEGIYRFMEQCGPTR
ncbi:hypothetical protein BU24DRAFT_447494 [Aaosphaeria arxii CBS 175.79]|uniref:Casein kinase II beta 2 subunit n=1 Tax=Aaosphaeria arxii CBS 175.79 TaxID=1450172 RepID=A0A6A5Y0W9_9PLEO|nr:uncharacterized protein BU24DRAFT_447494 [Aaosphaeria arxii CBS 175.79]KAF2018876.1 hypothetical protein BU24DRAFT_447494 [Aaosphaeria arxii CBS 175.79]